MKVGIAADHRGYNIKQKALKFLESKGYNVIDYSPKFDQEDDYTDHGFNIGEKLRNGEIEFGIVFCGSGIGISIACNKVKGARCGKVDSVKEAKSARLEDNVNIIALNSTKPFYLVKKILITFLTTNFLGVDRYIRRINELKEYEENGKLS